MTELQQLLTNQILEYSYEYEQMHIDVTHTVPSLLHHNQNSLDWLEECERKGISVCLNVPLFKDHYHRRPREIRWRRERITRPEMYKIHKKILKLLKALKLTKSLE